MLGTNIHGRNELVKLHEKGHGGPKEPMELRTIMAIECAMAVVGKLNARGTALI